MTDADFTTLERLLVTLKSPPMSAYAEEAEALRQALTELRRGREQWAVVARLTAAEMDSELVTVNGPPELFRNSWGEPLP